MSWRPQYRSSKFRHVFGKAAAKESCFDGVPITRSVQDNNFCAVNPRFLAVITECAGGGAFLVLSIHHVSMLTWAAFKRCQLRFFSFKVVCTQFHFICCKDIDATVACIGFLSVLYFGDFMEIYQGPQWILVKLFVFHHVFLVKVVNSINKVFHLK